MAAIHDQRRADLHYLYLTNPVAFHREFVRAKARCPGLPEPPTTHVDGIIDFIIAAEGSGHPDQPQTKVPGQLKVDFILSAEESRQDVIRHDKPVLHDTDFMLHTPDYLVSSPRNAGR